MKNNWILISLGIGVITGLVAYLLTQIWQIALIIGVIVFVASLFFNPKLFFARIAIYALSALISLNKFSFELIGELPGIDFTFKDNTETEWTTIILGIITVISLILYFLERNEKLKGTFLNFSINKNIVKDVKGENIHINQTINKK